MTTRNGITDDNVRKALDAFTNHPVPTYGENSEMEMMRAALEASGLTNVNVSAVMDIIDSWMEGYDHLGTGDSRGVVRESMRAWDRDRDTILNLLHAANHNVRE